MRGVLWLGIILIVLGGITWVAFKVAIWLTLFLVVAGLILAVWGAMKAKSVVSHMGDDTRV